MGFSLPTQRCFLGFSSAELVFVLFSAYAEVFPFLLTTYPVKTAFLCLRRGVSFYEDSAREKEIFSLPTQRCFRLTPFPRSYVGLFSAYAEVFLRRYMKRYPRSPFLCLRRGVSVGPDAKKDKLFFSLPTQRCFLDAE